MTRSQWFGATLLMSALLFTASTASAQSGSESLTYFGTLGQNNPLVTYTNANNAFLGPYATLSAPIGPNACVPTATSNGLTYLYNYVTTVLNQPSPFTSSVSTYGAVNAIATAMNTYNTN